MSPLVSVIVPTYQSAQHLEACLRSIREQTWKNLELIVVDNGSRDETCAIAGRWAHQVHQKGHERCVQRNHGVEMSRGEVLLIVDSDMVLTPRVAEACVDVFARDPEKRALVIPERSFGQGFWARCKALERSFYVGVDWMEAARAFRRETFLEAGGYDPEIVGSEDFDLPQRIETKYGAAAIGRIAEEILHDELRLALARTCAKKFYYAQALDGYRSKPGNLGKFARQSSPLERYRLFLSRPERLIEDPLTGAGMLFLKTAEFASGAAGYAYGRVKKRAD
ncbi:MAG: glycosyltransferase, group 2 family protein [Labilithrix sp.]|nr:glycosyltransferase, group 2 family protein [Labilithrix sp.]